MFTWCRGCRRTADVLHSMSCVHWKDFQLILHVFYTFPSLNICFWYDILFMCELKKYKTCGSYLRSHVGSVLIQINKTNKKYQICLWRYERNKSCFKALNSLNFEIFNSSIFRRDRAYNAPKVYTVNFEIATFASGYIRLKEWQVYT